MPTITRLERQKRNKERVNVYLDGDFAFGLAALDAAMLRKGQQLDEVEITRLKQQDAVVQTFDHAVQLLARRPRSIQEIRDRLRRKGREEAVIDAAIDRLKERGYVDDHAFARYWVENRSSFKPMGARALRYELRRKGVSAAIIDTVLTEMLDESVEDAAAYQAAQGRVRSLRGQPRRVFQQKMGAFLQRRGFPFDVCRRVIDQLISELETSEEDFFAPDEPTD